MPELPVLPGTSPRPDLLRVYLNDHLAIAAAARALGERFVAAHRDGALGGSIGGLVDDLRRDEGELRSIMAAVDVREVGYKRPAAMVGERLGRLKLNGTLVRRSPVSSVIEAEGLILATTAALAARRALLVVSQTDPRIDAELVQRSIRALRQRLELLETLHARIASAALAAR